MQGFYAKYGVAGILPGFLLQIRPDFYKNEPGWRIGHTDARLFWFFSVRPSVRPLVGWSVGDTFEFSLPLVQVTESISGSVVPQAMFPKCMGPNFFYSKCTRLVFIYISPKRWQEEVEWESKMRKRTWRCCRVESSRGIGEECLQWSGIFKLN